MKISPPDLTVTSHGNRLMFDGALSAGSVAIVDGDSIPPEYEGPIDCVLCPMWESDSVGPQRLADTAARVLDKIPRNPTGPTSVYGRGALASLIKQALGHTSGTIEARRSAVIIDLTGRQDTILDALHDLEDLGTLLLVGGCANSEIRVDTYPDLHARGLVLQGVPGFSHLSDETVDPGPLIDFAASLTSEMHWAYPGEPAPAGQPWYRVTRR